MIDIANQRKRNGNLDYSLNYLVMAGEDLQFEKGYFDLVVGSAILHHTDINLAVKNIHYVLSTKGRGIFIEPMNQNFMLKIWRFFTPWRRSPVERALLWKDIELIKSYFPKMSVKFFYFISMTTFGLLKYFPKSNFLRRIHGQLIDFDNSILNWWPSIGKYCAVVVLYMKKSC